MKNLFFGWFTIIFCASLIDQTSGQYYAPINLGNVWVRYGYEGGSKVKTTVYDTNNFSDSALKR